MESWNRAEQPVEVRRNNSNFRLAPCIPVEAFRRLLPRLDSLLEQAETLKNSRTTTAAIVKLPDCGTVFLKRTNNKGILFTLRYLFRRARAFRAAECSNALVRAGIETPAVLAVGEFRKGGFFLRSGYLINEARENAENVHLLLANAAEPERVLAHLLEAILPMLSRMHSEGVVHGDCKLSNLYLTPEGRAGTWDLDGGAVIRPPCRRRIFADLVRFLSSIRSVYPGTLDEEALCRSVADRYSGPVRFSAEELAEGLRRSWK